MGSVAEIGQAIALGDDAIRRAPVSAAEQAVPAIRTHDLLMKVSTVIGILRDTGQERVPRIRDLAGAICTHAEEADARYSDALAGTVAAEGLDVQLHTMLVQEGAKVMHNGALEMESRLAGAVGHLMAAAELLQGCDGLHDVIARGAAAVVQAQPAVLTASNAYRDQLSGGTQ